MEIAQEMLGQVSVPARPAEFPVHGVIRCRTEGLPLVKEHGKARLVRPSDLAYGGRGAPPKMKPRALSVFEVELLEVSPVGMGVDPRPVQKDPKRGSSVNRDILCPP